MARDYRQAEFFSAGTQPLSLWLWLFAVLAISGFAGLIYYLDQYEKSKSGVHDTATETPVISGSQNIGLKNTDPTPADDSGTHFDFYKLLPNLSVDVPESDLEKRSSLTSIIKNTAKITDKKSAAEKKTQINSEAKLQSILRQNSQPIFNYILQAASFKDYREADKLKARLALLGIEVKIEKVTLNSSDIWHRVRIGPIQSETEMNKIRRQLRGENLNPIMLKVKA